MVKVICDECQNEFSIYCENLDWEITSYEKHSESMGNEVHYNAGWEEFCSCENNLKVSFFYVEYPVGFLETDETTTEGCTLNDSCSPI